MFTKIDIIKDNNLLFVNHISNKEDIYVHV